MKAEQQKEQYANKWNETFYEENAALVINPNAFVRTGQMYESVFRSYVGRLHHSGRFREKMRQLYEIYKESHKAQDLQSSPNLQKKVKDTILNERAKVEGLMAEDRLPKGSMKLFDEITADMMKHQCSVCKLKGHTMSFCWLNQQMNQDCITIGGELAYAWKAYKLALEHEENCRLAETEREQRLTLRKRLGNEMAAFMVDP